MYGNCSLNTAPAVLVHRSMVLRFCMVLKFQLVLKCKWFMVLKWYWAWSLFQFKCKQDRQQPSIIVCYRLHGFTMNCPFHLMYQDFNHGKNEWQMQFALCHPNLEYFEESMVRELFVFSTKISTESDLLITFMRSTQPETCFTRSEKQFFKNNLCNSNKSLLPFGWMYNEDDIVISALVMQDYRWKYSLKYKVRQGNLSSELTQH